MSANIVYEEFFGENLPQNIVDNTVSINAMFDAYKNIQNKNFSLMLPNKDSRDFLGAKSEREQVEAMIVELGLINEDSKVDEIELKNSISDEKEFLKNIKKLGVWKSKRGKYGGMWCHPMIALIVAGWLYPRFRAKMLILLVKNHPKVRIEAKLVDCRFRDHIKDLLIPKIQLPYNGEGVVYGVIEKTLNESTYGQSYTGIRSSPNSSIKHLEFLYEFQTKIIGLMEFGVFKCLDDVKNYIQKHKFIT